MAALAGRTGEGDRKAVMQQANQQISGDPEPLTAEQKEDAEGLAHRRPGSTDDSPWRTQNGSMHTLA